jgi:hypothetical protein
MAKSRLSRPPAISGGAVPPEYMAPSSLRRSWIPPGDAYTDALVVSVVVTLLVYWLAAEYAEVIGEQVQDGRLPSTASVWAALAATWPMVTASYAPLLAVVLVRLAGASALTAANVGLVAAIVLLMVHGWRAGQAAQLRGRQLFFSTSIAAALGLVMIALKDLVLIHLH